MNHMPISHVFDVGVGSMFKVFGKRECIDNKLPLAMTLGNFDGVHVGHRALLEEFREFAGPLPKCVLTFFPHPTRIFLPDAPKPLILSITNRVEHLLATGVDVVVVQDFSEDFAELSSDEFLKVYLRDHFNIDRLLIGYDFSYGKDRKGGISHLNSLAGELGWTVRHSPPFILEGAPVSSSRIRECLVKGQVEIAERLLGYPYAIEGKVVHGDKRGRTIGFPTANLEHHNEILPAFGVYAVDVLRHEKKTRHRAVMNCGYRPTLGQDLRLQVEAHLLDFDEDLYGEKLSFQLRRFLRKEKRFSGLGELKAQIEADVQEAKIAFEDLARGHSTGP